MSPRARLLGFHAACLLAPGLTFLTVRGLLRVAGPAPAGAAAPIDTWTDPNFTRPSLSDDQKLAASFLGRFTPRETLNQPFWVPRAIEQVPIIEEGETPAPVLMIPPPKVRLTSIFDGEKTIAVCNGKPRTEGDEVAPGWVIDAIDADESTVTLRSTQTGAEHVIRLRR